MNMFDEIAMEIFISENVDITSNEDLFEQCVLILSQKMAQISHMSLSKERVDLFNAQKQALREDLRLMKKEGKIKGIH